MTRLLCVLLTLLFSLSGPAMGGNSDFCRSSFAANGAGTQISVALGEDMSSAAGITIWRHIPAGASRLVDAEAGIVRPFGATNDLPLDIRALAHDTGYTQGSGLTSWTADLRWALDRQAGMGGVILQTTAPEGSIWFNQAAKGVESQILVPGNITGTLLKP